MKKLTLIIIALFAISACDDVKKIDNPTANATNKASSLTLHDGTNLYVNGDIVNTRTKTDSAAKIVTYTVKFESGSKASENSVYGALSKLGYSREVIENSDKTFKIHYRKKGEPVIGSAYHEKNTTTGLTTTLNIYWKAI